LRNDLAPHLFYDDETGEWRGWACNFSTGTAALSKRADGGVNAVWSRKSPLQGLSVMKAKPLGLSGMPIPNWTYGGLQIYIADRN
jgi:hypothetical protein